MSQNMSQRQIKVEITEVNPRDNYEPTGILYVGRLRVAEYGYDFWSTKSESRKYCAESPIPFIKQEKWKFETELEAKEFAYKIANRVIDLIGVQEEKTGKEG